MQTLLALIGALALAAIPLSLGWRRSSAEAGLAQQLGLATARRRFDPEKFARQTGTGLTFRQIVFGCLVWAGGGLAGGLVLGWWPAVLFGLAGGLLYYGTLADRRQEVRFRQAKDILRALGLLETFLLQGESLSDSLGNTASASGPDGKVPLLDLTRRMRAMPEDRQAQAIREWTLAWDNPAVNILGAALLASVEQRIPIAPLVSSLRATLSDLLEVLSRARAAARGIEWQARFLALFPPAVLVVMGLVSPNMGAMMADNPLTALPVVLGSGISYFLSMRMIRDGLSVEASLGLQQGQPGAGEIRTDRMGMVL